MKNRLEIESQISVESALLCHGIMKFCMLLDFDSKGNIGVVREVEI